MRSTLAMLEGQRLTVSAIVLKQGSRLAWAGVRVPTVMLGQVAMLDGTLLCDHLWFNVGKRLAAVDLHLGDTVQFSARVAPYRRGFRRAEDGTLHYTTDLGLAFPSRVIVLSRKAVEVQAPASAASVVDAMLRSAGRQRILAAIVDLQAEIGEPPSLPRLLHHTKANPMNLVSLLRKMAKAGTIAFLPDGGVMAFLSTHGGQ